MGEALDTAMEWLRPLADANPWEYVVVWKLGDDPSRFIQWGDCCCSGGDDKNDGVGSVFVEDWCRDEYLKHRVKTRACKTLAGLPFVIPLYSGIHGDVATSKQAVWTTSVSDNEGNGTQVLIPVASGLIEFFSSKNVLRDEKIINYVLAQFEQDIMMDNLFCKRPTCSYNNPENWPTHCPNFLPQASIPKNYSSFEGSSSCSSLSNEHQMHTVPNENKNRDGLHSQSINNLPLKRKKCVDAIRKEKPVARNRQEKGPYKSKNLVTERNRRERIKAGMFALRSLVPKITKMDRASTLGDAADYIEELHHIIADYDHQLRALDGDQKCNYIDAKPNIVKPAGDKKVNLTTKMEVEVKQVGVNNFLLKIVCEHRRGGFSRLMEAIDALGFQVMDANVTTLNGLVSNVFRVEGGNTMEVDDHDPKALEYLLVQLVN